jgi:uncharacterized protein (DUF3084 family)
MTTKNKKPVNQRIRSKAGPTMSSKFAAAILEKLEKISQSSLETAQRLTVIETKFESNQKSQEQVAVDLCERIDEQKKKQEEMDLRLRMLEISRAQIWAIAGVVSAVIAALWQIIGRSLGKG